MQDVFTRRFDKPQHADVGRYRTLLHTLSGLRQHFQGRRVLDYGASYGVSMCALLELSAERVVGVEIEESRVVEGRRILADYGDRAELLHTPDTTVLPFADREFDCVLCNAVLEHIPQPRDAHIREMWRVLRPAGVLIVNENAEQVPAGGLPHAAPPPHQLVAIARGASDRRGARPLRPGAHGLGVVRLAWPRLV
ncbi:MAG TPA: class I SAM-dependent methyltransferase [Longimicrobiales bacterium]